MRCADRAEKYWPDLESIMVSHVLNESGSFVPTWINSNQTFETFLANLFPESNLGNVKQEIRAQYNCTSTYNQNWSNCASDLICDVAFTCNTRQLFDAYSTKAYMVQYSFPYPLIDSPAKHASDLIPTFWYFGFDLVTMLENPDFGNLNASNAMIFAYAVELLSINYKSYIRDYAIYSDPNVRHEGINKLQWPLATNGEQIQNVINARLAFSFHPFFELISDTINTNTTCAFWTDIAKQLSGISTTIFPETEVPKIAKAKSEDDSEFWFTVQKEL